MLSRGIKQRIMARWLPSSRLSSLALLLVILVVVACPFLFLSSVHLISIQQNEPQQLQTAPLHAPFLSTLLEIKQELAEIRSQIGTPGGLTTTEKSKERESQEQEVKEEKEEAPLDVPVAQPPIPKPNNPHNQQRKTYEDRFVSVLEADPDDVPQLIRSWRRAKVDFHDIGYVVHAFSLTLPFTEQHTTKCFT